MKKFAQVLLISIIFLGLASAVQAVVIDPSNPNIQYMGRWNFDNPSAPWIAWKGSTFKVRFDGTAITADVDAGEYTEQFRVIIDGVPNQSTIVFPKRRGTVTIASGLSSGVHTIEVMKETFSGMRRTVFTLYGLDITGTIMTPPAKPTMKIEWFGDSDMSGESLYSEQDSGDHGSYYAFPAVVSRMLNAEFNDQSVGGATLADNGDNCISSFLFSEDYYNQDLSYRSGFQPDVIVINAGANDVGDGDETIKQSYRDVIANLRTVYGDTPHIILHNGYGWDPAEPANYTPALVAEIGGNLSYNHYPWVPQHWHGCMIEHSGMANRLAEHILTLGLGFTQVQESEVFDGYGHNFDVANGSFEFKAKGGFDSFGWRYITDPGIERVYDPSGAYDGDYYVRLTADDPSTNYGSIQQGNDATGDFVRGATSNSQQYTVTAMVRGANGGEQAQIIVDYQAQQVWARADAQTATFTVTSDWQPYSAVFTAPDGTWMKYVKLRADSGIVDVDYISMTGEGTSSYCGDGTCDPDEDSCNCASDCGAPPAENCTNGTDDDCDGDTDCDDADCSSDPACQAAYCGDDTCDPDEDSCNCATDCGAPPASETNCTDGTDDDCDGNTDCDDTDCDGDPACPDCAEFKEYCDVDTDCCSGTCRRNLCR